MIFELVVVDNREESDMYPVVIGENHVKLAVFVGQSICGLHYRGQRPNKLTRLHRPLETELELRWERDCLLQAMDRRWSEKGE